MTYNIIKTENYLLVVTDKGSLEGYAYHTISQEVYPIGMFFTSFERIVVCHLPLNNSPILQGVDLLPPLEQEDDAICPYPESKQNAVDWHNGYNKAKEKAKENLHEILSDFYYYATDGEVCKHETINEFIQSLSQPKIPIGFECEMENKITMDGHTIIGSEPKTTTTPEGHTQWIGTYIFN